MTGKLAELKRSLESRKLTSNCLIKSPGSSNLVKSAFQHPEGIFGTSCPKSKVSGKQTGLNEVIIFSFEQPWPDSGFSLIKFGHSGPG